jgi:RNA polymerase sigma-70 factor (ECF subfamily)
MILTDLELVHAAREGNMSAFEELVHRYDASVLGIASRFGNSRDDAKDIYQEVFLRVFRNLDKFEGRSEFSTWLYRITTNVCLTFRSRKKKGLSQTVDFGDNDDHQALLENAPSVSKDSWPDHRVEAADVSTRVQEALKNLSPQQKLVFIMKHYEGYKLREIASMMKCAEGTVKRYLFTATHRLRLQLQDLHEVLS